MDRTTKEKQMGRPINKRYFSAATVGPTALGNEIKVNFHNGSAVKEGFIVRQKGSKKFIVSELGAVDTEVTCTLRTGILPSTLGAGEMSITVLGADGETYTVSKISGRRVTVVAPSGTGANALDGQSLQWQMGSAESAGIVRMEEAGETDDAASTTDDDFTDDA